MLLLLLLVRYYKLAVCLLNYIYGKCILQTIGSSAAQSSSLPCFDAALGIRHEKGQKSSKHHVTDSDQFRYLSVTGL